MCILLQTSIRQVPITSTRRYSIFYVRGRGTHVTEERCTDVLPVTLKVYSIMESSILSPFSTMCITNRENRPLGFERILKGDETD